MNDSTSTTSPGWPTRWPANSFTGAWTWLLAAFVAALFLLSFVAGVAGPHPRSISPRLLEFGIVLQFVLEGALVVGVLAALPRLAKLPLRELGFVTPTISAIGTGVAGAVAMAIVADGTGTLIERLVHTPHRQESVEIFKHLHDPTAIVIFAIAAVIAAPIAEESIFRAFFFNLGLRYGGFWGGALLSAVLFGLAHGDVYEALPLALGGLVLCYVYYSSRNAFTPMISHALFNAFTLAALLIAPKVV